MILTKTGMCGHITFYKPVNNSQVASCTVGEVDAPVLEGLESTYKCVQI